MNEPNRQLPRLNWRLQGRDMRTLVELTGGTISDKQCHMGNYPTNGSLTSDLSGATADISMSILFSFSTVDRNVSSTRKSLCLLCDKKFESV